MAVIAFSSAGRRALEAIIVRPSDRRQYRRAQAWLWVAEGARPTAVAQRRRLQRDPIWAGAKRYGARGPQPVATRVRDRARTGRPRRLAEMGAQGWVTAIEPAPQALGYRAAQWTPPWRRHDLREHQALAGSEVTGRRGLRRLG
jgi:hypothetical protein